MVDKKRVMNRLISEDLDLSIYDYIDEALFNFQGTEEEFAIAIYIKIAELFWYNPRYIVDNNLDNIDELYDISIDNNQVICLHWAIIYSKLLDRYGIDNRFLGNDEHLMVKVCTDDFIIFADATRYGVEGFEYLLSDLTNTKLDLKITGMYTLSSFKNKELDVLIDRVYKKLNMPCYEPDKLDRVIENYRMFCYRRMTKNMDEGLPRITEGEVRRRINFLNYFYHLKKDLHEVERLQIFSKYYKTIFEGFNFENCRCVTMCELGGEEPHLIRLIIMADDNKNIYYYLEKENGYVQYDKNSLMEEFNKRKIVFKADFRNVLGFSDDEVKNFSKNKEEFLLKK